LESDSHDSATRGAGLLLLLPLLVMLLVVLVLVLLVLVLLVLLLHTVGWLPVLLSLRVLERGRLSPVLSPVLSTVLRGGEGCLTVTTVLHRPLRLLLLLLLARLEQRRYTPGLGDSVVLLLLLPVPPFSQPVLSPPSLVDTQGSTTDT
jgi:hypothetical protein